MPKDKIVTHHKIISSAKKEFLESGFEKASMQKIAQGAGITAPGLYRHFKDKESMFAHLVNPVMSTLNKMHYDSVKVIGQELKNVKPEELWAFSEMKTHEMFYFMYTHFDEFKLLSICSHGTKFEGFLKNFIEEDVSDTYLIMKEMKKRGILVKEVEMEDIQLLMSGFYAMLLQFVIRDYSLEQAERASKLIIEFFYAGWNKVFGV